MAIATFNEDVEIISQLSDYPNDDDGLEPDELKAKFDLGSVLIKEYINGVLIPAIEAAVEAAARGITFEGISGTDIQDGTVYSNKLSSESGNEAVASGNIREYAVLKRHLSSEIQTLLTNLQDKADNAYNKVNGLATVASSGAYSDLSGIPTVDTALSNDSANAVQNKAIKSAIDAINTSLSGKQATLTFTSTVTNDSKIPYSSAVYAAIQTLNQAISGKAASFGWDATPISGSQNAVRSGGVYTALANKQDKLTIDSALSQTSTNPLQNKAIYSAIAGKQNTLSWDTTPTSGSSKPVTSGGIYTALGGKAPTSHASSANTYGVGNASNYGHLKLSDSYSTSSGVSGGIAATPTAVKVAYDLANTKQAAAIASTATFSSGSTGRTVTCQGVTANNKIVVSPAPASYAQWVDNRVRLSGQNNGTLSFTADTATTASITVNIVILN